MGMDRQEQMVTARCKYRLVCIALGSSGVQGMSLND